MSRPRLFRAVYGGGPHGGRWSDAAKRKTMKRLLRMLVRLLLGPKKVAEYDALILRLDAMTPEQMEAERCRVTAELKAMLNDDPE